MQLYISGHIDPVGFLSDFLNSTFNALVTTARGIVISCQYCLPEAERNDWYNDDVP